MIQNAIGGVWKPNIELSSSLQNLKLFVLSFKGYIAAR